MQNHNQSKDPSQPQPSRRGHRPRNLRPGYKKPETAIERFVDRVRDYLHISDPGLFYAVLGAMAGNLIQGPPVWVMLVGPSGSGKTTVLDMLKNIPMVEPADSIDTEAAFLSGSAKKDIRKGATGGLLRAIEPHGCLVMKDFTGVLSLQHEKIKKILDVLRQVYDGSWDRPIGGEGGRTLHWEGRAAMFSAVTGKIDEYHQVASTLGERWLYYRLDHVDGFSQLKRGLENAEKASTWREELRDHTLAFFEDLDLRFGDTAPRRAMEAGEIYRIARIAKVAARCRSGVTWNNYRPNEIDVAIETETESRVGEELGQLYIGMEYIGVQEADRWRVVEKMALDSMPKMRRQVLDCVIETHGGRGATLNEIMRKVTVKEAEQASRGGVDRAIIELCIHGVLQKGKGEDGKSKVEMTEWMKGEWAAFGRK